MSNSHLIFAKKLKDDEYYTRRFLVEIIFNKTVARFGINKVLYVLAADGDCSYFTKYAKVHKLNYVNNIDLYDAPNFIYDGWKTVIITNPPFSLLIDWLKKLQPYVTAKKLELCLIVPVTTMAASSLLYYLTHCYFYPFNSKMSCFFYNMELKSVNTILMSSFEIDNWPVHPKDPPAPTGSEFTTPVTRIINKKFYEACGYHLADIIRPPTGFKCYLWQKK